jgi:hypothetical protein
MHSLSATNTFFVIFLATIVISRVTLLNKNFHCPTIFGLRLHHYMYGIVLIFISVAIHNVYLYAVGWGLFIDQFPLFFLRRQWRWEDCYTKNYFIFLSALVLLVFIFKDYLIILSNIK